MLIIARELASKFDHQHLANAVLRLQAMSQIVRDTEKAAWIITVPGEEYKLINEAVLRAAARTPLATRGRKMNFKLEEFTKIALEESPPEGKA